MPVGCVVATERGLRGCSQGQFPSEAERRSQEAVRSKFVVWVLWASRRRGCQWFPAGAEGGVWVLSASGGASSWVYPSVAKGQLHRWGLVLQRGFAPLAEFKLCQSVGNTHKPAAGLCSVGSQWFLKADYLG